MWRHRLFSWILGGTVAVASSTGPAGAQPPLGDDFQINTQPTVANDDLDRTSVAARSDDSFVVVWDFEDYYSGYTNFVRARRYAPDGDPVGDEFSVSGAEAHYELNPDAAAAQSGSFLVVWASYSENRARHYDASGTPTGDAFVLSSDTGSDLSVDASDTFVAAWEGFGDGSSSAIWARLLDSDGVPVADEFLVNTYTTGAQRRPDVAVAGDGSFAVTWQNGISPAEGRVRWFDPSGVPLTDETLLDPTSPNVFLRSRVAHQEDRFLVVWDQDGADGDSHGIRGRLWDQAGQPLGAAFDVNLFTTGSQRSAQVAAADDGTFLVVWENQATDGQVGLALSSTGAPLGAEFVVNSNTAGNQSAHAVGVGGATFTVVWSDREEGEDFETVEGRRFQLPFIFSDGFESGDTTAWVVVSPGRQVGEAP